ncbi:MAG: tRNA 2-thiouridine(34) synthase MnmA [Candidatus Omnitrophica bacterium]|nr:tRNA 2-thiouridine(34) synthase MnmA [Candidatus Omnitrophota bacterium]
MPESVVVAMSGGVDSSTAAYLLKEAGFSVIGMTLKTWPKELCDTVPRHQTCCSTRDIEDARLAASQLGIPFYVVEASVRFKSEVMDPFVEGYAQGLTPNPCVVCNRKVKSGILLEKAQALGVDRLATGHYAGVVWDEGRGRYAVRQAADPNKDQSYVLFQLSQDQLSRLLFPLGEMTKAQVRAAASRAGLKVADKPESMELCFIPDGDTQGFLRARAPGAFVPGPILDRRGNLLGTHQGIGAYTVGQRKGLGIAHPRPLYVLELDPGENRVIVGEEEELAVRSCRVKDLHWMAIPSLEGPIEALVKIRYRSGKLPARLVPERGGEIRVEFLQPVEGGVSPGQAAVFYEGDVVLGGGWIARAIPGSDPVGSDPI